MLRPPITASTLSAMNSLLCMRWFTRLSSSSDETSLAVARSAQPHERVDQPHLDGVERRHVRQQLFGAYRYADRRSTRAHARRVPPRREGDFSSIAPDASPCSTKVWKSSECSACVASSISVRYAADPIGSKLERRSVPSRARALCAVMASRAWVGGAMANETGALTVAALRQSQRSRSTQAAREAARARPMRGTVQLPAADSNAAATPCIGKADGSRSLAREGSARTLPHVGWSSALTIRHSQALRTGDARSIRSMRQCAGHDAFASVPEFHELD